MWTDIAVHPNKGNLPVPATKWIIMSCYSLSPRTPIGTTAWMYPTHSISKGNTLKGQIFRPESNVFLSLFLDRHKDLVLAGWPLSFLDLCKDLFLRLDGRWLVFAIDKRGRTDKDTTYPPTYPPTHPPTWMLKHNRSRL